MLGSLNYYARNLYDEPVVSVSLCILGDNLARGICFYRPEPGWSMAKKFGREEAELRSVRAMSAKRNVGALKHRNIGEDGVPGTTISNYAKKHDRLMRPLDEERADGLPAFIYALQDANAIDIALVEGVGVWHNENVLNLYRGVFNPVLTPREHDIIKRRWSRLIPDVDTFLHEYSLRVG